jgi:hypothetical protein
VFTDVNPHPEGWGYGGFAPALLNGGRKQVAKQPQSLELDMGNPLAYLVLLLSIVIKRLTADLQADLKTATGIKSVLINRFLYDRGFL